MPWTKINIVLDFWEEYHSAKKSQTYYENHKYMGAVMFAYFAVEVANY